MATFSSYFTDVAVGQPIKASHILNIGSIFEGGLSADLNVNGNLSIRSINIKDTYKITMPSGYSPSNDRDVADMGFVKSISASLSSSLTSSLSSSLYNVYTAISNVSGSEGGGGDIILSGYSVYGRENSTSGNGISITAASDNTLLRRSGVTLGFGTIGNAYITDLNGVKITNGTISGSHIVNDAITSAKIANGAIGDTKLATGAVTSIKIATGAVTTSSIANNFALVDNRIQNLGNSPSTWDLSNGTKAYANIVTNHNLTLSNPTEGMTGLLIMTQAAPTYTYNVNIANANKTFSFGRNTLQTGTNAKTMISFIYINSTYHFTFTPYS